MIEINLRVVAPPADFRSGVERLLTQFIDSDENAREMVAALRPGDAVMFLSKGQNQVRFIYRPVTFTTEKGRKTNYRGFVSVHVRLDGRLDPRMLANIAELGGLHMVNRKRYEEYFVHLQESRKSA